MWHVWGKEACIIIKMFSRTNARRTKNTIDFMMFWIHSTYCEN